MRRSLLLATTALSVVLAACSSGAASAPASSSASASPTDTASIAPTDTGAASPSASASAASCDKASLKVVTAGKLTIGTDNPAYPPYFAENTDKHKTAPWELGDPTNGQGFESAVAYAIATKLGFAKGEVTWTVVPFANSFAPGPKAFDFDINQVTNLPERAANADLSTGYYFGNQSLVALKSSPLAKLTSIAALKDYVYGAQTGTISYDTITDVIAPSKAPQAFDTNDAAVEALKNKSIDGLIVDLPTADYVTNVQVDGSTIVGQFSDGTPAAFSAVLAKDSPLTDCVNDAISSLTEDGTLDQLASKWLPFQDAVPAFQP